MVQEYGDCGSDAQGTSPECALSRHYVGIHGFIPFFISPLFNQVGKLRTSSHLQLRPGQDKAKQFDTYNTDLHME
jgi:hypothetical protein